MRPMSDVEVQGSWENVTALWLELTAVDADDRPTLRRWRETRSSSRWPWWATPGSPAAAGATLDRPGIWTGAGAARSPCGGRRRSRPPLMTMRVARFADRVPASHLGSYSLFPVWAYKAAERGLSGRYIPPGSPARSWRTGPHGAGTSAVGLPVARRVGLTPGAVGCAVPRPWASGI